MAKVPTWTFFAYFNGDAEGERDERREVADWQLDDVVRWARHRGFDTILLSRGEQEAEFHRVVPTLSAYPPNE